MLESCENTLAADRVLLLEDWWGSGKRITSHLVTGWCFGCFVCWPLKIVCCPSRALPPTAGNSDPAASEWPGWALSAKMRLLCSFLCTGRILNRGKLSQVQVPQGNRHKNQGEKNDYTVKEAEETSKVIVITEECFLWTEMPLIALSSVLLVVCCKNE